MLRKSTKIAALLVAAASITSIMPASAAERLGTKDGTITRGFAYADGKYLYDGYRTDDDDAAIYFNDGKKDKQIDDYDDYDMNEDDKIFYGTKYVTVEDGGDEYLLDLSTGKIDDDESVQDKFDNAKSKLYTNLKKADRYSQAKAEGNKENGIIYFDRILQGQRGDVWYQYTALGDSTTDAAVTPVPGTDGKVPVTTEAAAKLDGVIYSGFANENGSKYIDITHEANIYALVKKSADANADLKTVKLSEYEKDNDNVTARFLGTEALTQDNDYIYAVTTVQLTYKDGYAPNGVENNVSVQKFLQKIAKAQGDKEDGAYIPKSITSYQLDADKKLYTDDDVQKASQALGGLGTTFDGHTMVSYQVKNSTIYAVGTSDDNIKVWALKLKKSKIDTAKTDNVDTYVAIKDDDYDQDIVNENAYAIDIDGNIWALDKGKVYKSNGSDFKEMYTCDRALDKLDVYDDNNLMIWEADGDVYTNVAEGKKQTDEDAGVTDEDKNPTTPTVGWNQNANGTWSFYDATGAQMKASWVNLGGTWYYLKADGVMATGWLLEGGNWYFLNPVSNGYLGAMKTGWIQDNGTWYYLNASGAMKTGWFQDTNGTWYFLKSNGAMAANEYIDGYYLGSNGAWVR
ncbi:MULTISPECIES: N-acetylmuramoyl-L-alanine amidase family protein [Clostridium]|uniref:N-acetylmuramoyl-L-alanine amidase family protein n=1 Tax=Clostridium TaxID=1485 RepID=UPI0013D03E09|nr:MULTISPECIES: N-acetylmuramoyl-L-alanine amidase family protein [Clostridium]MCQ2016286.1 N-acetylmuramoyl-L-alanine amidase family protein [Clostridium butyricum]MCQ2020360.1 N-acetylmuramoyl-L-alanine amidase family protein [Clostridium butyricum]MDU1071259.1 N-acetylmuramoyl-L-alanine amidase family protein [Clostridium sp.]MDU1403271.1 N-acetylmuramoyl-L-alanine amidase family protein [Clostridium sp.]MDU2679571.1 N-acetylmuramoyl-L-alanine amidase family protein [Clostridium sp.]